MSAVGVEARKNRKDSGKMVRSSNGDGDQKSGDQKSGRSIGR